jgi:hypothetical protein
MVLVLIRFLLRRIPFTRLLTIFSCSCFKKTRVIAVTGDRIIPLLMDTRVKKNALLKHHEREIISLLKRAYFVNTGDNSGLFFAADNLT